MRVQRVLMPGSEAESWTLLGDEQFPLEPVERFLGYLTSIEKSPNTVKAYAHDLKDWFTYLTGPRTRLAGRHRGGRGRVRRLAAAPARGPRREGRRPAHGRAPLLGGQRESQAGRPFEIRAARLPPLQDGELVAQDQDLGGFPRRLAPGEPQPRG